MLNSKQLRSFYIIEAPFHSSTQQVLEDILNPELYFDGRKIFIKTNKIDSNISEIELRWETVKEIKTEELDESGEIHSVVKKITTVANVSVWIHSNYSFIYLFIKSGALLREVLPYLETLLNTNLKKITFNNEFFYQLIGSNFTLDLFQSSFRSNNDKQLFSISGDFRKALDMNFDFSDNVVTGITVLFNCLRETKAKVYKAGKIALYNSPDVDDIICIIENISDLLMEMGKGGFSLE
ncbi:hypothetical protein [Bacillus sp. PK3_68]|uniref:hypothetical protein n=1 Tax=Bacillus sp. PK3_68 TaxID=2027408 RepID=UPI000E73E301|nr:hypothetical protein [Bacillus sp. PK3_68]RJS61751.1 hypothetical protein CJ483_18330 [Bacillus sp. PK3_68]